MRMAASQHKVFFFALDGFIYGSEKTAAQTPRQRRKRRRSCISSLAWFGCFESDVGTLKVFVELNRLDDRELADIGITRCDIQQIAWEAARS